MDRYMCECGYIVDNIPCYGEDCISMCPECSMLESFDYITVCKNCGSVEYLDELCSECKEEANGYPQQ